MKILLFGKNGQVGWELSRVLQSSGQTLALGRADADFCNPESLRSIVRDAKPNVIVNAAAYTAVDKAEEEEDLALLINGTAPQVLAEEAETAGALLIHYSTDYVFDGTKNGAYIETDIPGPVNAYGRTKLAGETAIQSSGCNYLVLRTSWVYSTRGHNFLLSILRLARERQELKIVDDQFGAPTAARVIAETSGEIIRQSLGELADGVFESNLYHLVSSGYTSWYGLASKIIENARRILSDEKYKEVNIEPISTDKYPTAAIRPRNSRLSNERVMKKFNLILRDWEVGLERVMQDMV